MCSRRYPQAGSSACSFACSRSSMNLSASSASRLLGSGCSPPPGSSRLTDIPTDVRDGADSGWLGHRCSECPWAARRTDGGRMDCTRRRVSRVPCGNGGGDLLGLRLLVEVEDQERHDGEDHVHGVLDDRVLKWAVRLLTACVRDPLRVRIEDFERREDDVQLDQERARSEPPAERRLTPLLVWFRIAGRLHLLLEGPSRICPGACKARSQDRARDLIEGAVDLLQHLLRVVPGEGIGHARERFGGERLKGVDDELAYVRGGVCPLEVLVQLLRQRPHVCLVVHLLRQLVEPCGG